MSVKHKPQGPESTRQKLQYALLPVFGKYVEQKLWTCNCIVMHFTDFPANKPLPYGQSRYTKVIKL